MFRMIKWLFILTVISLAGVVIWSVFAIWIGYYSVYSYPPSELHPDGSTLIIKRDDREPMFNSQFYIPEKQKKTADGKSSIGFGMTEFTRKKPIEPRTVFTLPYSEWAFEQSLNEAQVANFRKGQLKLKPQRKQ